MLEEVTLPVKRPALPRCAASAGPIFISGCNRGGTTIVSRLLALHPDVRSVGRGPFHEGQYVWRRQFPDWSRHRWALPPWRWYLRRTARHASPAQVQFFHEAFDAALDGPGRMLEKTPANAVRIPFINALYPDACFVHVLRDGRHTAASLLARGVWLPFAPHQWVNAHRTALPDLDQLPTERVTLVRYEMAAQSPETTLRELWHRCGLRQEGSDVEEALLEARRLLVVPEDRWSRLPRWQQRYILRVIGDLQQELRYPLAPP
jgi:hypothetical protein